MTASSDQSSDQGSGNGAERGTTREGLRPGGPESLVGAVLSERYVVERLIGEGGMGAVYQAEHTHMHKRMAVKVLHPEMSRLPEVVARFEREAMAAAHIEHPNVAGATDFGKLEDGSFFLVLEYVEGVSLRDALARGRLELSRASHIAKQIASALARAHALGIVHRDLKPENVMLVSRESDPDFVKVLDFGIAKVPMGTFAGESQAPGKVLTQLGMVYGTPEYMAPEQALGQDVDSRADLYALGVILFEMIAGKRPYEHDSKVTLLGMHVAAPIPSLRERVPDANVPAEFEAVVTRLLAKDAAERFADSKQLIEALDAFAAGSPAGGAAPEPSPPPPRASLPQADGAAALALGPTSFAEPATASAPGSDALPSSKRVVSLARETLREAMRSAPPWMTASRAAGAAAGFVALLVIALIVGGSHRSSAGAVAPPRPPDPRTDDLVGAAQARLEKGDVAGATDALTAIEKTNPDRPDVHMLLERAYTTAHDAHDAVHEGALWLAADPNAVSDAKLQEDTRNGALVREGQDDAFALLESKMGPRGVDILYDIAYGASGKQYPQAAARARHSLDLDDVRGRASPALSVLLDFRDAKTCDARHALLDRARQYGDARMEATLQPYLATRGCGFFGHADCYGCLHKDTALKDALAAIEARGE
jgi:serine/threonine protein kinase